MVEAGARDTLQPALLDRLTDSDPSRKTESRDERIISRTQLRALVLRDLSWLFNTTNISAEVRNWSIADDGEDRVSPRQHAFRAGEVRFDDLGAFDEAL